MQDPRVGVVQPDEERTPEERDHQREEAARELEELKQAWLRAYHAQGIDPQTVNYDTLLLEDDDAKDAS